MSDYKILYRNARNIAIVAIVAILLSIGALVYIMGSYNGYRGPTTKEIAVLELWLIDVEERHRKDSIDIAVITTKRKEDSIRHYISQIKLKEENKKLKRLLIPTSDFFTLLNDTTGIHDQMVRRDSIIENDSLLIDDLEDERDSIKISYNQEVGILQQSKVKLEKDLVNSLNQNIHNVTIIEQKQNTIQRLKTWLYGTGAVGVVLAVILTVALL
jgi:hypothetical protein